MKLLLRFSFFTLLFVSLKSTAQFAGAYDPSNWNSFASIPGPPPNTGYVDVTGAPTTVVLIGSDDDPNSTSDVDVYFTIYAPTAGVWSFDWEYNSNDASLDASVDLAEVIVNGFPQPLADNSPTGSMNQTGSYSGIAAAGDIIGFRVRTVDNLGGNATLTITNFLAPAAALPVRLNIFNAKQSGEQVKLDWSTASEINSDRFEVERSTNGKDFKVISSVKAAGNSTLTQNYSAIDNNPENGNNYYRLRQVDLDGKFVYSMIKTLKWTAMELVKVYPNPARENITVRLTPQRNETTSISLIDGAGRLLQRRNIAAVAGSNIVTDWNVSSLAPGIYFFKINNAGSSLRFVKQ